MRRATAAALLALAAGGCAYPGYVHDEYRYIPLTNFAHDNQSYRIFDKPSAGKLIITPSLATAMSDNIIRNVTFGRYNNAFCRSGAGSFAAGRAARRVAADGSPRRATAFGDARSPFHAGQSGQAGRGGRGLPRRERTAVHGHGRDADLRSAVGVHL